MQLDFDQQYAYPILGIDEAGRGALAGPVVVAGIVCETFKQIQQTRDMGIDDSKKISPRKREEIYDYLIKHFDHRIVAVDNNTIDAVNILNATMLGAKQVIIAKGDRCETILMDGNKAPDPKSIPIVNGDNLSFSIACGSILAKVARDMYMLEIHQEHPDYMWDQNKGYPTRKHKEAILRCGESKYHRSTFKLKA